MKVKVTPLLFERIYVFVRIEKYFLRRRISYQSNEISPLLKTKAQKSNVNQNLFNKFSCEYLDKLFIFAKSRDDFFDKKKEFSRKLRRHNITIHISLVKFAFV